MSQGRILVIRGGAIGDFILTLPAIAALRRTFSETRLEVLGYPHIACLASLGFEVLEVKSIEAGPLAGFFARGGTLSTELCSYFAGFNLIVSYLYDPDLIFQQNVARCSKAQFIAGPHRPNENENIHATDVFLQPLQRLAIFDADPVPRLKVGPQRSSSTLAIHPGSGSDKKNWPLEHWAELLRTVVARTAWPVMIVGGEAELARVGRLRNVVPAERLTLATNLPLPELAKALAGCRYFVGHDSGITHLAAAVGLSGIALWNGSNVNVWRPRSDRFQVLHPQDGLGGLPAQAVFTAVNEKLRV